MLAQRFLTRTVLHSRNIFIPIQSTHRNLFAFSNYKPPLPTDIDVGNLMGLHQTSDTPYLSIWEKLSEFGLNSMYTGLDTFSREFLFTLANDLSLGLPAGILCTSLILRLLFFYPGLIAQVNGLKMKDLQPFMKRYQEKMQAAQMSRNKALMKQASKQFNQVRKERVNFLQFPLLITWFLSLRYITNLPEVYTQVQTEGFLWIKDLSAYDPYFILPIISALLMSVSIMYSPSMNKNNITMPFMIPFIKYLKFMPFVSLPITAMFPAAINMYWMTVSCVQCLTVAMMHSRYIKEKIGLINKVQKPKVIQAAIVEEKRSENGEGLNAKKEEVVFQKPIQTQTSTETVKVTFTRPKKSQIKPKTN